MSTARRRLPHLSRRPTTSDRWAFDEVLVGSLRLDVEDRLVAPVDGEEVEALAEYEVVPRPIERAHEEPGYQQAAQRAFPALVGEGTTTPVVLEPIQDLSERVEGERAHETIVADGADSRPVLRSAPDPTTALTDGSFRAHVMRAVGEEFHRRHAGGEQLAA